mmetsp:Transcript_9258/g.14725  ORF Transcript_9258/g.14725 Transcript_9258/m.14725 type:complete len:386 (-) Transcript_9258:128-1285(-)|eukprot:CAMPEP_0115121368 /NCGR_PEP_ID=MMETSP0227-20121206/46211_1 /TAXON_ID=89957 /ORGANISM="Polarella glacialis, Strain CCMP 1383" /LENGTH=385 /DNA_ID=CAMNT_0002523147 /DNA_START=109 /DNA_END=1266 /DNA_ORIENTATION=+
MASVASQVDVQAPPGLEHRLHPTMPDDLAGPPTALGLSKDELVREVTAAVREHMELKTAVAVDQLWQKGQKAMQYMQQQHISQTDQLRSQLAECAESYQKLEHENAMLRSSMEALMKHLTGVFGSPSHLPAHSTSPFFPPPAAPFAPKDYAPVHGASPSSEAPAGNPWEYDLPPQESKARILKPHNSCESTISQDFHTPAGSPRPSTSGSGAAGAEAEQLVAAPQPATPRETSSEIDPDEAPVESSGGTGAAGAAFSAAVARPAGPPPPEPVRSFSLTLRRADTIPVGLDVRSEESCLVVERVRPGGAVEAWNRQCPGDNREILAGDRIIMINGQEDADVMREECLTKYLLRMTVVHGPPCAQPSSAAHLRAEASEFVPQAAGLL